MRQSNRRAPQRLLYVDDNADDVLFFQEAARRAGVPLQIDCVSGPASATDYLDDLAQIIDRQEYAKPALALLDCHFPGAAGTNLIEWIRAHPQFSSLPIVVFTGSEAPDQVARCYGSGADYFLVKPTGNILSRLTLIVQALHAYVASNPTSVELLVHLPEYRPDPTGHSSGSSGLRIRSGLTPWVQSRPPSP